MTAIRIAVIVALAAPQGAFAQNFAASRAATAARTTALPILPAAPAPSALMAPSLLAPSSLLAPAIPSPGLALALPALTVLPAQAAAASPVSAAPAAAPSGVAGFTTTAAGAKSALIPALAPANSSPADPGKPLFDGAGEKYKAFIVVHGRSAVEVPLAGAGKAAKRARLLVAPNDPAGVSEKDAGAVKALLGAGAKLETDKLAVNWTGTKDEAPADAASPALRLSPLREARFLAKAFKESLVRPSRSEIVGGLVTKTFPFVTTVGVFWATIGLAHPLIFAALVALNLSQEVFHGAFLKSWNNFQERLSRERGFNYQMFFNLAYMQGAGMIYRGLAWLADPKAVIPPWNPLYLKDVVATSLIGTFFGTLGYNGLNTLYAKGAIGRWQHSGIQQLRDLFFLLAGPFFATGSMGLFWLVFAFQQSLDLAIGVWAGRASARPVVIVVSAAVAASPEFRAAFPADGLKTQAPLKQAWTALRDNPISRLLTWPLRALAGALKKRREGTR